MIIRIEVEAVNAEELKAKLNGWIFGGSTAACPAEPPAPVQEALDRVTATEILESQKKPVGRPRKAVEAPVAEPTTAPAKKSPLHFETFDQVTAAVPTPAPKAEKPKKYTLDQVRSALQTYAQKVDPDASVGILKVRELLAQFQSTKHVPCQKISEVQDQDYAALVAACGA